MQFKLIFILLNFLSLLAVADETNLFQSNYFTQSNNSLHSLQNQPDTKIYAGMNKDKDNTRMLEDGYDLMGTSSFQGPFVEPNQALKHAQSIQADVVFVYDRKMNEMTRSARLRQIRHHRGPGRGLTHPDLHLHDRRHRAAAHPALRSDRGTFRSRGSDADRAGARGRGGGRDGSQTRLGDRRGVPQRAERDGDHEKKLPGRQRATAGRTPSHHARP